MVLGDVLAGIQLVKQSVAFIKDNINTCKDISEIASNIDDLFEGKKQVDRERNAKSGFSTADQFGIKSVTESVINQKLAAEELYNISILINNRFGSQTWKEILAERHKRIEDAKAAQKEQIKIKKQEQEQMLEIIGVVMIFIVVLASIIGVVYLYFVDEANAIISLYIKDYDHENF